jgi:hypothetical protein
MRETTLRRKSGRARRSGGQNPLDGDWSPGEERRVGRRRLPLKKIRF